MEYRLSRPSQPTRELPVRSALCLPTRPRGFHETIGIAVRRNCSPVPAPVHSEDEGMASISSSQASMAGDCAAARTKRPRGRPLKNQTKATEASGKRQASQGPSSAKKQRGRPPKATRPYATRSRTTPTPPSAHVSRSLRNCNGTPTTPAANPTDSSTAKGEGQNSEGREVQLATPMLKKLFEHVWSTYYSSIDRISDDQIDSALKIFFERTAVEG